MISIHHSDAGSTIGGNTVCVSRDVAEISREFIAPRVVSAPPPAIGSREVHSVDATLRVFADEPGDWSNTREREFTKLAALKALKKATSEDLARFERLQGIRRRTKNPLSAEEILFQYRRREMEAQLLSNLQQYVAFLEAPR